MDFPIHLTPRSKVREQLRFQTQSSNNERSNFDSSAGSAAYLRVLEKLQREKPSKGAVEIEEEAAEQNDWLNNGLLDLIKDTSDEKWDHSLAPNSPLPVETEQFTQSINKLDFDANPTLSMTQRIENLLDSKRQLLDEQNNNESVAISAEADDELISNLGPEYESMVTNKPDLLLLRKSEEIIRRKKLEPQIYTIKTFRLTDFIDKRKRKRLLNLTEDNKTKATEPKMLCKYTDHTTMNVQLLRNASLLDQKRHKERADIPKNSITLMEDEDDLSGEALLEKAQIEAINILKREKLQKQYEDRLIKMEEEISGKGSHGEFEPGDSQSEEDDEFENSEDSEAEEEHEREETEEQGNVDMSIEATTSNDNAEQTVSHRTIKESNKRLRNRKVAESDEESDEFDSEEADINHIYNHEAPTISLDVKRIPQIDYEEEATQIDDCPIEAHMPNSVFKNLTKKPINSLKQRPEWLDDQAEESEDEYAAAFRNRTNDDDESDEDDDSISEEDRQKLEQMIDDSNELDATDQAQIRKLFREEQDAQDQKALAFLMKGVQRGSLKKRRFGGFDLYSSDDDDETDGTYNTKNIRRLRQIMKRQRLLAKNEHLRKLDSNERTKAFLKSIEEEDILNAGKSTLSLEEDVEGDVEKLNDAEDSVAHAIQDILQDQEHRTQESIEFSCSKNVAEIYDLDLRLKLKEVNDRTRKEQESQKLNQIRPPPRLSIKANHLSIKTKLAFGAPAQSSIANSDTQSYKKPITFSKPNAQKSCRDQQLRHSSVFRTILGQK